MSENKNGNRLIYFEKLYCFVEAVKGGDMTINQAYQQVRQQRTTAHEKTKSKKPNLETETLYTKICSCTVTKMAIFLNRIQNMPVKTVFEWTDDLNQLSIFEEE